MGKKKKPKAEQPQISQEEKVCINCNEIKNLSCFKQDDKYKDGYKNKCNNCIQEYNKNYRAKNKDRIKQLQKQYILANKEKMKLYHKKYSKEWEAKNKEKRKKQKQINFKIWRQKNKDYNKIYKRNHPVSLNLKIATSLSNRINDALKRTNLRKNSSSRQLLGCSIDFFKEYIKSKFTKNMTWENRGVNGWHLDHIIPCSSFDLSDPEQQKKCFHYTNYQPLWATTEIAMLHGENENYIGNIEKGGVR